MSILNTGLDNVAFISYILVRLVRNAGYNYLLIAELFLGS